MYAEDFSCCFKYELCFYDIICILYLPVGENSGKASKGLAKYTGGIGQVQERAGLATSEIGRAKLAALERGEKLGVLDDKTEQMKMESETYAKHAHELMLKYKDKKWYQF